MAKRWIILLLVWGMGSLGIWAQQPDSVFADVQKKVRQKAYDEALQQLESLIATYPQNLDYQDYKPYILFWSGRGTEALTLLESRLAGGWEPLNLLELSTQIYASQANWPQVERLANLGITHADSAQRHPFAYYKALSFVNTGKPADALPILESIPRNAPVRLAAQALRTQILQQKRNYMSAGYVLTQFSGNTEDPRHVAHIEYMHKTPRNAYIGRVNYGYMFQSHAVQLEADVYLKVKKRSYVYLNSGFAPIKTIFPTARVGAEFYHERTYWSISGGARYLHFDNAQVAMLTGHIAGLYKQWSISYRPYVVYEPNKWFQSHILAFRKNWFHRESFVQLEVQYGGTPYYFFTSDEFTRVNAYRAGISGKARIARHFFIHPIFMYEWEEFVPGLYRHRFNSQLILTYRF